MKFFGQVEKRLLSFPESGLWPELGEFSKGASSAKKTYMQKIISTSLTPEQYAEQAYHKQVKPPGTVFDGFGINGLEGFAPVVLLRAGHQDRIITCLNRCGPVEDQMNNEQS